MVYAAISSNNIVEALKRYLNNSTTSIVLLCVGIILLILWIITLISNKKIKNAARQLEEDYALLSLNYDNLSVGHKELTVTRSALDSKLEELIKTNERISKLAYIDYLTELPSHAAMTEVISGAMLTLRTDETVILMLIDISNYRNINTKMGALYGETLLVDISHRLQGLLDENDYLARGEVGQFIIFTQNIVSMESYQEKVDRICWTFEEPFLVAAKECFARVSIGITVAPKDGKTTNILYKNAELAVNIALELGKNRYYYFDESLRQRLAERMELQADLRKAIEEDQFVVYYQPQMDLDNNVVSLKAFVQWEHPVRGLLMPDKFIPAAEENGMILKISEKVLLEACKHRKQWDDSGICTELVISINLTTREFKDKDLVQRVSGIIELTEVNPEHIEIEIEENILIANQEYAVAAVNALKSLGVRCSIGRFQTGYSSISYLKRIKADNIKISRNFLDSMLYDEVDRKVLDIIMQIAEFMDFLVIAEGVESSEQEALLKEANCRVVQGYQYCEPVTGDAVEMLLRQN